MLLSAICWGKLCVKCSAFILKYSVIIIPEVKTCVTDFMSAAVEAGQFVRIVSLFFFFNVQMGYRFDLFDSVF